MKKLKLLLSSPFLFITALFVLAVGHELLRNNDTRTHSGKPTWQEDLQWLRSRNQQLLNLFAHQSDIQLKK